MAASAPTGNLPESTEEPDLVVLAGGAGTRMGNADKGLVQIDGLSLAETLLSRLGTRKRRVIISANRNQPLYQKMCDQVVSDQRSGFAGPLAGIEATVRCTQEWLPIESRARQRAAECLDVLSRWHASQHIKQR